MSATYLLLITLYLTEGGTLEAEADSTQTSLALCREEAHQQEIALRREFALAKEERGICPFTNVKIRCERRR